MEVNSRRGNCIRRIACVTEAQIGELADVLMDCVGGGASVSFMQPLARTKAIAFWRHVADGVAKGERILLVAEDSNGSIVGTVQLVLNLPENQPHRADVAKLLVHRRARRGGLGADLMRAIERVAEDAGKTLLVLDTVTCGDAERLYQRLGWERCGVIPGYALWPQGGLCDTTIFYRTLASGSMKIEPLDAESAPAGHLLALSDAYMAALYPAESNHLESVAALKQPGVLFLGGYVDGRLVACGAVKQLADDGSYGEIKRLFVLEPFRGRGFSKAMMERLEAHLRDTGIHVARLETGISQPEAIGLYRALGYVERAPFGSYRPDPLSLFMEKRLAAAGD